MQLTPETKEDEHELDKVDPILTLYRHGKVVPANGEILKQSTREKKKKRGMFRTLFNQLSQRKIFFRLIPVSSGPLFVSEKVRAEELRAGCQNVEELQRCPAAAQLCNCSLQAVLENSQMFKKRIK